MGAFSWQDAGAALAAALALGWLAWRRVRASRRGAEAACESCPSAAGLPEGVRPAPTPEVLLAIGEPHARDAAPKRG
jgi:hypothetical protein